MRRMGTSLKKMLISCLIINLFPIFSSYVFADVLIVAHKSVFENSMKVEDLRNIFLGKKKKWDSHVDVHVSINQSEEVFGAFASKYLKRSPEKFLRHWKGLLFTGEAQYPRIFSDSESVLSYVSSREGAIGYINSELLDDSVKVIKITE